MDAQFALEVGRPVPSAVQQAFIGCATTIRQLVSHIEKPTTGALRIRHRFTVTHLYPIVTLLVAVAGGSGAGNWHTASSPDGQKYYWNSSTRAVTWDMPPELGGTLATKA